MFFYIKIFGIARQQAAEILKIERMMRASTNNLTQVDGKQSRASTPQSRSLTPAGQNSVESGGKRKKNSTSDTKAIRTLGLIFGMFYVCWQPFFIMWVVLGWNPTWDAAFPVTARGAITWLGYLNRLAKK